MNFYENIEPFIDYLHSIRKLENYLSIDLKFPTKWVMPKNVMESSQIVPFESDLENTKGLSFVCESSETEIDKTTKKIESIIKLNKEREIKERLFKDTVDKLKSTFEKTELKKLKKLYFDFEDEIDTQIELDNDIRESSQMVGE